MNALILPLTVLVALIIVGVYVVRITRQYATSGLDVGNETVTQMRAAYERGDLTREQFARVKAETLSYWRARGIVT